MHPLFLKGRHRIRRTRVSIEPISVDLINAHILVPAVTFGAGIQWYEAYDYIDGQGRFVVGGLSQGGSVGSAGGWVMGGGHSAFSPSLGLGKILPSRRNPNN